MLDSDNATQVNENIKGHTDQLKAIFVSNKFPEFEMPVPLTDVLFETSNSNSSNSSKRKSKKKILSNPRDKNPLNASKLIKSKNARIEMAQYQRQAVNLKPPQQAVLLEPCIVWWRREPVVPQLRNIHRKVGEALIWIWQN
jgi:hypothetical protein